MRLVRIPVLFATLVVLAAVFAATSSGSGTLSFVRLPQTVSAGKTVSIVVRAKTNAICSFAVRFAGNAQPDPVGTVVATNGLARWSWHVPDFSSAGVADAVARCGAQGSISRRVQIVGGLIPPKIIVAKQGFSTRPRLGGSTTASYGVVLKNTSPNADALNVYIIVNFVMADGHLIGTAANTVPQIAARSEFNYGGSLSFPGAAPIDHLEIIIQVGGRQRGVVHPPTVDGVRAVPGISDAAWLGEVDGETINESSRFRLVNTQLWAVVFDANGNVLGGGTGSATAALPPGTRQAFALLSGLDSVPWSRVATARVSTVGTYAP